jgi:hypothetical protein
MPGRRCPVRGKEKLRRRARLRTATGLEPMTFNAILRSALTKARCAQDSTGYARSKVRLSRRYRSYVYTARTTPYNRARYEAVLGRAAGVPRPKRLRDVAFCGVRSPAFLKQPWLARIFPGSYASNASVTILGCAAYSRFCNGSGHNPQRIHIVQSEEEWLAMQSMR